MNYERKKEKEIIKLKENNTYVELNIDKVEQVDIVLDIIASVTENDVKYTFYASYVVKNRDLSKMIRNNMNNLNYSKIRAWVDLKSYNNFEFDIDGFFNSLDIKEEAELSTWESTNKPIEVDELLS